MSKLFIYLFIFNAIISCSTKNRIMEDEFCHYLPSAKLSNSIDFNGISSHGELFTVNEYSLSKININNYIKSDSFYLFPRFNFVNRSKSNVLYESKWKHSPLKKEDVMYKIVEMARDELAKRSLNTNVIDNNFYYSYISFFPGGNFIFIISPTQNKFLIIKKRG